MEDWRKQIADFGKDMLALDDKALALFMQYVDWRFDRIVNTVRVAVLEGTGYEIECELTNYFAHDNDIYYYFDKIPGVDLNSIYYYKSKADIFGEMMMLVKHHFYESGCTCEEDEDYEPSDQEDIDTDSDMLEGDPESDTDTSYYRGGQSDSDSDSLCEEFAQASLKRSLDDDVDMPVAKRAKTDG